MTKIIGVRFQPKGELFYCDANDIALQVGDYVVVNTEHGLDLAKVVIPKVKVQIDALTDSLMPVVRKAEPEDLEQARQSQERQALTKCNELVAELGLKMKPLVARYNLKSHHLTVFFSARERVDFRGLVRKLRPSLETRVELRQIGPRDEARLLGGIGKCGYPLCCQSFLAKFTPVSVKMAKEQDLALNSMRISGICGRLLCCLGYESEEYAAMKRKMPQPGQEVSTPFGKAEVLAASLLKEMVTVKFDGETVKELPLDQLTWEREPIH